MICILCNAAPATVRCNCCNDVFCDTCIGASMYDTGIFKEAMKDEKKKKYRPPNFRMETIRGPHVVLRFMYNQNEYFLFGEDHDAQPQYDGVTLVSKVKGDSFAFEGSSTNSVYIERFFLMLFREETVNIPKEIYLEVVERSIHARAVRGKKGEPYVPPEIGQEHLSELLVTFKEPLVHFNNTVPEAYNVTIHPVDYRIGDRVHGTYAQMPDYVSHYSIFFRLYKTRQYDLVEQLFPDVLKKDEHWDTKLLYDTLFDTKDGRFREFALAFKKRFDDLFVRNRKNKDLKFFSKLPGLVNPSRSYNADGISIQAQLYARLPPPIQDVLRVKCQVACRPIPYTRTGAEVDRIEEFNLWFMDAPALAKMLTTPIRNGKIFGYFGADHVTNMLKVISKVAVDFDLTAHSGNGVDLTPDMQDRLNMLILY